MVDGFHMEREKSSILTNVAVLYTAKICLKIIRIR